MKNKNLKLLVILFVAIFILAYFSLAKDENKDSVTQGELARILVERMDLDIAKEAPAKDYFGALEAKGIKPAEGWNETKPVTTQDLGEILVEVGRLQAEVLAGKDIRSVLKERGVILPPEINKKTLDDILRDRNVNRLLETPAITGPSVPFPIGVAKIVEPKFEITPSSIEPPAPSVTEALSPELPLPPPELSPPPEPPPPEPPPPEPPPPEPPPPEPPRPSGGGAQ